MQEVRGEVGEENQLWPYKQIEIPIKNQSRDIKFYMFSSCWCFFVCVSLSVFCYIYQIAAMKKYAVPRKIYTYSHHFRIYDKKEVEEIEEKKSAIGFAILFVITNCIHDRLMFTSFFTIKNNKKSL